MDKREINFFEAHIEKIVLVIVGGLCAWLLLSRVLLSPNYVEYDNRKFSTGEIDEYVLSMAEELEDHVNLRPQAKESYNPRFGQFEELFDSTVRNVDLSLVLPKPAAAGQKNISRKYMVPQIVNLQDVKVGYLRAVGYVPLMPIDKNNTYRKVKGEPNDIDFVTVEASLNTVELYRNFHKCFAGYDLEPEWRDPDLARPIFAAVELQRQQLLADGSWSPWQRAERMRIDHRKELFEIIEDVNALPAGGIKVRLLQYDDVEVMRDLLQPDGYRIASANDDWFPPSFHSEYLKLRKEKEIRQKRKTIKAEREERQQKRIARGSRTSSLSSKIATDEEAEASDTGGTSTLRSRTGERRRGEKRTARKNESIRTRLKPESIRTENDIYKDYDNILIVEETDLSQLEEPLLIWANDDSIEPGNRYRYRIRLGVFNPIANTDQFKQGHESMKDNAILWSDFSESQEDVEVPAKQYFFARDLQEAASTVTVQVSKYFLGRWYSKDFAVSKGEDIGTVAQLDVDREQTGLQKKVVPDEIDYTTGAILVDVKSVNDWSGDKNLRARQYSSMLYSRNGTLIEQMPIKNRY